MSKHDDGPGNDLDIGAYIHCGRCIADYRTDPAAKGHPATYAQLSVGWTPKGLQVWCNRHNANVVHIDFEGRKHPANTTAKLDG